MMVRFEVTAAVPDIEAGCEAVHVGGSIAPAGLVVMAQVTATAPVKPPLGVIVTVEVALEPADATVAAVPLSVNTAGGATVKGTEAVCDTPAELPVTVTV